MKRTNHNWLAALLLFTTVVTGCGSSKQPTAPVQTVELNVSAAVSLKDALAEIQQKYHAKNPNVKIVYNLGASGSLQKQIEQGAPVDLFISAAAKQIDDLTAKNLILIDTRRNLLENQLVMITPKKSPLEIQGFGDITNPAVLKFAMGEPEVVPAGQYTQQVLKNLNIWEKTKEKAVLAKDVRTILAYVETGNVEAGFVYKTDAAFSNTIRVVGPAPTGSHQPIIYPAAILSNATQPKAAADFLAYLSSAEAKPVFEKYGFTPSK